MHFDFLIEDSSGKDMLEVLIPKIIDEQHSYTIHSYRGVGHLPKGLKKTTLDPSTRVLLNQLPKLIQGFGNAYKGYGEHYLANLVVVIDLDSKNKHDFLGELNMVLGQCSPKPNTSFCLAVEEGEAWLLGDINAIKQAYPKGKYAILSTYSNDSICGTWEILADTIYIGGVNSLKKKGNSEIGKEKSNWAKNITPHMDINNNLSPSFCYFRDKVVSFLSN